MINSFYNMLRNILHFFIRILLVILYIVGAKIGGKTCGWIWKKTACFYWANRKNSTISCFPKFLFRIYLTRPICQTKNEQKNKHGVSSVTAYALSSSAGRERKPPRESAWSVAKIWARFHGARGRGKIRNISKTRPYMCAPATGTVWIIICHIDAVRRGGRVPVAPRALGERSPRTCPWLRDRVGDGGSDGRKWARMSRRRRRFYINSMECLRAVTLWFADEERARLRFSPTGPREWVTTAAPSAAHETFGMESTVFVCLFFSVSFVRVANLEISFVIKCWVIQIRSD